MDWKQVVRELWANNLVLSARDDTLYAESCLPDVSGYDLMTPQLARAIPKVKPELLFYCAERDRLIQLRMHSLLECESPFRKMGFLDPVPGHCLRCDLDLEGDLNPVPGLSKKWGQCSICARAMAVLALSGNIGLEFQCACGQPTSRWTDYDRLPVCGWHELDYQFDNTTK